MVMSESGTSATTQSNEGISNQLAILVPSFDPSVDSVEIWASKIELLTKAWPTGKLVELATRIVLNCKGTAYQKLQLHAAEILVNDLKGIRRIVELVGGAWGQVPLEKTYELIEKAFFRCSQKSDELSDSYLSRCDVIWSDLLMRNIDMQQVQACDDKKRVIVESGAESSGKLDVKRVSQAIRMLGSGFFQEYTSGRKDKQLKTYDHTAFSIEEVMDETDTEAYWVTEDSLDEDLLETLAAQEDEDASLILQFEEAVVDNLQQDPELSAYFSTYQEARRRLSEKVKTRGFWPIRKGEKGKSFGKGKSKGKFPRSLSSRIASSFCRNCGKKGHWKNECPERNRDGVKSSSSAASIPTSFAYASEVPPELQQIPTMTDAEPLLNVVSVDCLFGLGDTDKSPRALGHQSCHQGFHNRLRKSLQQLVRRNGRSPHEMHEPIVPAPCDSDIPADCLFVSTGTQGVVDLGASQTVIGSAQVPELLQQLPPGVGSQIRRVNCNLVFRFGNQQTLASHHALMVPLKDQWFRIAVVPGRTPFLLSSSFLRYTLQAIIDTEQNTLYSKRLKRHIPLEVTSKNLYLMNLNTLWEDGDSHLTKGRNDQDINLTVSDCAMSDVSGKHVEKVSFGKGENKPEENLIQHRENQKTEETQEPRVSSEKSYQHKEVVCPSQSAVDQENSCVNPIFQNTCDRHHVECDSTSSAASSPTEGITGQCDGRRCEEDDAGGVEQGRDHVWQDTCRNPISRDVPESRLHGLVCGNVSRFPEAGSHEVRALCGTSIGPGTANWSTEHLGNGSKGKEQSCQWSEDRRTDLTKASGLAGTVGSSGASGGHRRGVRDAATGANAPVGRTSSLHAGGEQESQPTCEQDGRQCRGDSAAPSSDVHQEGAMKSGFSETDETSSSDDILLTHELDWDFEHPSNHPSKTFQSKCVLLIRQMNKELKEISQEIDQGRFQGKVSRADLFEIMCHDQSELVAQCSRLGGVAFRFGLKEGDLSTSNGRRELFRQLCIRQPTHIWYSPKCGPWSMWSNFNMNRSLDSEQKILQEREESLWQISLAVVLFRFQQIREHHFHMEQPQGSAMWKVPTLEEIHQQTERCVFDLCRVGSLKDPASGKPIRKRLTICTTSELMIQELNGKYCLRNHDHQQIFGSTKWKGKTIKRSEFSEHYPPKFGRQLAKIILKEKSWSYPVYVQQEGEHPTKRRRLLQKLSPAEIVSRFASINWQTAMQCADKTAPRVGTLVVEDGTLFNMVQSLCPNYDVSHLVLCRGTDRSVGPNKRMHPGTAPLRKFVCIRRRFEDVQVDSEWEPWERLSYNALRRKTHAARVGMTIFARAKLVSDADRSSSVRNDRLEPEIGSEPPQKRVRTDVPEPLTEVGPETTQPRQPMTEDTSNSEFREHVDLIAQKHGPKFLALDQETQKWLLKIHRNMGHPGNQKLMNFCRQIHCPESVIQRVADLKCSTCLENKSPSIARPSAIHESQDFGDVVSMDGVSWKNQKGQHFHFYHLVDQSTSFQTAIVSPSRTSEHACAAIIQAWISWAGAPSILVTDAATEFTSDEFATFLQRFNIHSKVIAAEAHWQNSRAERHGGILQEIITKMDMEESIDSYEKLTQALAYATHTKNQWSRHRGYPPELLVLGKGVAIHASNINDSKMAAHSLALSDSTEGQRFREELSCRERARRAYASVDNDQSLRRALVHRSRPHRGNYQKGEPVMVWRKRGESDGHWQGPMTVVIQESHQVVWVTMLNKLYRVAPEHIRPLSATEETQHKDVKPTVVSIIPNSGGTQYHDLIPQQAQQASGEQAAGNPGQQTGNHDNPPGVTNINPENDQPDQEPSVSETPPQVPSESGISTPVAQSGSATAGVPAEQVPIPGSDEEDGLFQEAEMCFHVETDQKWEFEILLSEHDIQNWRHEDEPHECAFLVSAAKKQRSEVKLSTLSSEERQLFEKAKGQEIDSWISTGTIAKILRHQIPLENIMRCRWILTWKNLDEEESKATGSHRKPKARLVVLGYEDPQIDSIPRDSPTMSKLSRMFVLQTAASQKWTIESFDIKTAFLRGTDLSQERKLAIEPPKEMRDRLKLRDGEVLQLLKGAYGRVDAPYLWFVELKSGLEQLGFTQCPFDPCLFALTIHGETHGLIGIHVDDGLCCGSKLFQQKLIELEKRFPFGSRKKQQFVFTGLQISQKADYSIHVDQEQYVKDIQPITIGKTRRQQSEEAVSEEERQSLRAVIGSLQYASTNTRPDLGSRLGWLQSQINRAKVSTLLDANRVLHEAKEHSSVRLIVHPIPIDDIRFVAFSDASFASEKCHDSHQGMIIMAAQKQIGDNRSSVINPIVWHSRKIQKVAVSTLSAEAMALAGAVDSLSWVRLFWAWLRNTSCPWKDPDMLLPKLPPAFSAIPHVTKEEPLPSARGLEPFLQKLPKENSSIITTDCKSLYDLVSRTATPACQEFRTVLQAKLIKEHLQNGIHIRWVPSGAQIADALTKIMDSTVLRECLKVGQYSLHDEAEILRSRADSRTRVKWLHHQKEA